MQKLRLTRHLSLLPPLSFFGRYKPFSIPRAKTRRDHLLFQAVKSFFLFFSLLRIKVVSPWIRSEIGSWKN